MCLTLHSRPTAAHNPVGKGMTQGAERPEAPPRHGATGCAARTDEMPARCAACRFRRAREAMAAQTA